MRKMYAEQIRWPHHTMFVWRRSFESRASEAASAILSYAVHFADERTFCDIESQLRCTYDEIHDLSRQSVFPQKLPNLERKSILLCIQYQLPGRNVKVIYPLASFGTLSAAKDHSYNICVTVLLNNTSLKILRKSHRSRSQAAAHHSCCAALS